MGDISILREQSLLEKGILPDKKETVNEKRWTKKPKQTAF